MEICQAAAPIPSARITALETELERGAHEKSAVKARMACKSVIRQASALLEASPEAPNRYAVLGVLFQSQKRLLGLENTEQNRAAIFATCRRLMDAPEEYAEIRLEADLLLSERDLSDRDATLGERAEALAELLERYRGTKAESRSLLMAALIVQKLDAPELENAIYYALDERFSDDVEVIEFRRKFLKISRLDVTFTGRVSRMDGADIRFPADTMGHVCLMVFWSGKKPGFDEYLDKIKEQLEPFSGLVDVFSFNLDELADGGASILDEHGLDWTVMQLPGGRTHEAYRTYAQADPVAVLVNEYGLAVIRPEIVTGLSPPVDPQRISEDRYMAQLQSLFIGDFLVGSDAGSDFAKAASGKPVASGEDASQLKSDLQAIQSCFVPPPFRYRLTREEALANYRKAAQLCGEVVQQGGGHARELRHVRDRRIIALLGMWTLACEPRYLEQAVAEATAALKENVPAGADVVPRFCLAKAALRRADVEPKSLIADFLAECGGDDAPASAVAAAAILAVDARSRELHENYSAAFLEEYADNPDFYAFTSFLRDRYHRYRLLMANHSGHERGTRGYIINWDGESLTNPLPTVELKQLDGSTLTLPGDTNGKLTFLLFVEPPAGGPTSDYPITFDGRGRPVRSGGVRTVMGYAETLTKEYVNKDINFVAAFLTDDAEHVNFLVKANSWSCTPALVPGGLDNPMVRQLGVYSADRFPNVFLLRRNGTIAWRASGFIYKSEFGFPFAFLLGMKMHVEICDVEHACKALERGDFKEAARVFGGPYLPWNPDRFGWRPPRYHGKALALMGLKDWDAALESIDTAIESQKLHHFRGRRRKHAQEWQMDAATVTIDTPDDVLTELWAAKAVILDKLGRKEEAAEMRKQSGEPARIQSESLYKSVHERLKTWRMNQQER